MPGVPAELHFFVFQPRAVAIHVALLAATAIIAALYPRGWSRGSQSPPRCGRRSSRDSGPRSRIRSSRRAASRGVSDAGGTGGRGARRLPAHRPGDHIAICGPSGCGKSTLLHLLGCVDSPSRGTLLFENRDVAALGDRERSQIRLTRIGFVFQRFFLLPMLTAAENVELPQAEAGVPRVERQRRTAELLGYVGLAARADHRPSQLSGGEMQRVAIARALANRPRLLLADEPTGELDQSTGEQIAALLDRVNADGTALVIVTHDEALARRARRILIMRDGTIVSGANAS